MRAHALMHTGHEMRCYQATLSLKTIKQLNEQIIMGVYALADATSHNSRVAWPHLLLCMAILLAVMSYTEAGLAMQDQCNPYTLERIVAT